MEQIFIKNIKINKVRHLKNLDIPVCENKCKHIILTGQNGSGKTSILDAIAVFLNSIVMGKHPEDIFAMINDTQKYMEYNKNSDERRLQQYIETHLHLDLQKKIMELLTTVFPNIQFVVSSHSPFILNSLDNVIIYDLENNIEYL